MFVAGDLLVFTLFFGTYLHYLELQRNVFVRAQEDLSQPIGVLNTFLMLTSSWCIARAVRQVRERAGAPVRKLIVGALLCGLLFLIDKGIEWTALIAAGHTLLSGNFFMLFFMFTGIHAVHVLIGMGLLLYLLRRLAPSAGDPRLALSVIESGAIFWHLVDLLWIVLFALFYLVR